MAEQWLRHRGLTPVYKNYQCRAGELDLVMNDGKTLVIVEVKFRRSGALVSGPESVTARKQKRLALATMHLLQRHRELAQHPIRFDVVAITKETENFALDWIRDAFRPAL